MYKPRQNGLNTIDAALFGELAYHAGNATVQASFEAMSGATILDVGTPRQSIGLGWRTFTGVTRFPS